MRDTLKPSIHHDEETYNI